MKILALLLVCVGLQAQEKEQTGFDIRNTGGPALTADTIPDSLAGCLKKANIDTSLPLDGRQEQIDNQKILDCVQKSAMFELKPRHLECKSMVSRIRTDKGSRDQKESYKEKIEAYCNENFFRTIACVDGTKKTKEKLDKASADKKESLTSSLDTAVGNCVEKNAKYFDKAFCEEYLITDLGMAKDSKYYTDCVSKSKAPSKTSGTNANQ